MVAVEIVTKLSIFLNKPRGRITKKPIPEKFNYYIIAANKIYLFGKKIYKSEYHLL